MRDLREWLRFVNGWMMDLPSAIEEPDGNPSGQTDRRISTDLPMIKDGGKTELFEEEE